jgi:sugar fermentation stimulation protein A
LKNKEVKEFLEYKFVKPEYRYERTRFDFFLANERERCLLEVKSCTLVKEGVALFPDAPTMRGQRHLKNLIKAKDDGYRSSILFVVQRNEPNCFSPNDEIDPDFGKILRQAALQGVEIYAYRSIFLKNKIFLDEPIKVEL